MIFSPACPHFFDYICALGIRIKCRVNPTLFLPHVNVAFGKIKVY